MPRGDMAGTVLFTDRTNRLCCEIQFGEIKVSRSLHACVAIDGWKNANCTSVHGESSCSKIVKS